MRATFSRTRQVITRNMVKSRSRIIRKPNVTNTSTITKIYQEKISEENFLLMFDLLSIIRDSTSTSGMKLTWKWR